MAQYGALEILFHRDAFERLYVNACRAYNVDDIPPASRQHPVLGAVYVTLFLIYETSHLLCLPAIWHRMKNSSCYKIMFFMSVLDITALPVVAFGSGIFMFLGLVYCSAPTLLYALSFPAPIWWYGETMAAILLAFNRCVDLMSHRVAEKMFGGWKTWAWLLIPALYGLHHNIFSKTTIFSGVIGCWHFNPHVGYIEDTENNFSAHELAVHNIVVLVLLTSLYAIFCARMLWDMSKKSTSTGWRGNVSTRKSLFLQVLLISINHLATAFFYAFMHYVHANAIIASIAQMVWISAHGVPGVVYLTMNVSMRKDVKRMLGMGSGITRPSLRGSGSVPGETLKEVPGRAQPQSTTRVGPKPDSWGSRPFDPVA